MIFFSLWDICSTESVVAHHPFSFLILKEKSHKLLDWLEKKLKCHAAEVCFGCSMEWILRISEKDRKNIVCESTDSIWNTDPHADVGIASQEIAISLVFEVLKTLGFVQRLNFLWQMTFSYASQYVRGTN